MKHHTNHLRSKVKALRSKGLTFSEILSELNASIPKSTMSSWCKDVALPKDYQDKINLLRKNNSAAAREKAVLRNKQILQNRLSRAECTAKEKIEAGDIFFLALVFLYWGEGGKWPARSGLLLGTSDHGMLTTYISLLQKCYSIDPKTMKARLNLRADQDESIIKKFWSEKLGFIEDQFYETAIDKRTVGNKSKRQDYPGVCTITCKGADIQLELQAAADIISRTWGIGAVG